MWKFAIVEVRVILDARGSLIGILYSRMWSMALICVAEVE